MLLCDELLLIASVLRSGDAGAYHQQVSSRRLVRIADDIHRLEQLADGIVGQAQDEEHLLAVSERRRQMRLVSR